MARGAASEAERELYRKHSEVLQVMSNPLRHEILHRLAEGDRTASELVALTGASKSNISQHVALLKAYGLVEAERKGRSVTFRLAYPQLAMACQLIDEILLDQVRKASLLYEELRPEYEPTPDGGGE